MLYSGLPRALQWFDPCPHVFQVQTSGAGRPLSYHQGATVLCYEVELSPRRAPGPQGPCLDTEGSSGSEGSQDTGDSGRYSHDGTEMLVLCSGLRSRPASLSTEERGGSEVSREEEEEQEEELEEELEEQEELELEQEEERHHSDLKIRVSAEMSCHQYQQNGSQPPPPLCV